MPGKPAIARQRLNQMNLFAFVAARSAARRGGSGAGFRQIDGIPPRSAVNSMRLEVSHNFLTGGSFLRRAIGLISFLPPPDCRELAMKLD